MTSARRQKILSRASRSLVPERYKTTNKNKPQWSCRRKNVDIESCKLFQLAGSQKRENYPFFPKFLQYPSWFWPYSNSRMKGVSVSAFFFCCPSQFDCRFFVGIILFFSVWIHQGQLMLIWRHLGILETVMVLEGVMFWISERQMTNAMEVRSLCITSERIKWRNLSCFVTEL